MWVGRTTAGVTAGITALAIALAPAAADAKKKHKPKPKPPTHAEKCEQAPAGGKGPLDRAQVTFTNECFDTFEKGLDVTLQAISGEVQGCPSASAAFNDQLGSSDIQLAKAGEKDVAQTKKAKVQYFKDEREWYATHKGKHHAEIADQLDTVVGAIGKATFHMSGTYASIEGVGSALRNNDCGEAATHLGEARTSLAKAKDQIGELRKALAKL